VNGNVDNGTVILAGREVPYTVRPSRKARQVSLRIVEAGSVEVVVPARTAVVFPEAVIARHAAWVLRTFDRLARTRARSAPPLGAGSRLPFLGMDRTIRVVREDRRRPAVALAGAELAVHLSPASGDDIRPLLARWIRKQAERIIPARVEELSRPWGLEYGRVTVRDQRTRWGSCSRRGTLSLNWRLLILPPDVADYLIYHELAHLKHMNHSVRFWKLVQTMCPSFREAERWLRRNGRSVPL